MGGITQLDFKTDNIATVIEAVCNGGRVTHRSRAQNTEPQNDSIQV